MVFQRYFVPLPNKTSRILVPLRTSHIHGDNPWRRSITRSLAIPFAAHALIPARISFMPNEVYALFDTTEGKFKVHLFADRAPKTVENFVSLAEGAKAGKPFYDGLIFHRVIPDFMVQGGCPEGSGRGGPGYKFADEFHPELKHAKPGMLSMANSGPNTNGSQFFITVAATPWLDNKHTIFGEVVEGQDVANAISEAPRGANDKPRETIVLKSLRIERT